jgi:hypothetical protein
MTTRIAFTESSSLTPTTVFAASGALAVGDVVYQVAGADKTVAKADADNALVPPIGVVHSVVGTDVVIALNGEVAAGLTGLTRGTTYWLGTTAGSLVSSKPASNAYIVGVAVSSSELLINTVAANLVFEGGGGGGGGGGGTVTSFDVSSSDLTVSNNPITGSGVIDLALNTVPVSKGGTGLTSATEQGASLIASSDSAYVAQASSLSWRNRVINGDMRIAQRGTAAIGGGYGYPVDRFFTSSITSSTYTVQQSSDAPTGFSNSVVATVTNGVAPTSGQYAGFEQKIEGSFVHDMAWGTSAAKTFTISFWVRSSVTGVYGIRLSNSGFIRSYTTTYTINSANTWEKKVITIPGDTSGIWETNNTWALQLYFDFGSGSSQFNTTLGVWRSIGGATVSERAPFIQTTGATWYITGVQLEVGSVATPFEVLPYEKQLELCQRYFARLSSSSGNFVGFGAGCSYATATALLYIKYPQQMRAAPTFSQSNCAIFNTLARNITGLGNAYYGSDSMSMFMFTPSMTQTVGQGVILVGNNNAAAYIDLNAEL